VTEGRRTISVFLAAIATAGLSLFIGGALTIGSAQSSDPCALPGADEAKVEAFLAAGCYRSWVHDPEIRKTGPVIDGVDYFTHGRVRAYYSPEVYSWLVAGRPEGGLPTGAMVVKENYHPLPEQGDELWLWTTMVRVPGGSWDGWFWSNYVPGSTPRHVGEFGYSACIACHASADNRQLLFATLRNIRGEPETYDNPSPTWRVLVGSHATLGDPRDPGTLRQPLTSPNAGFRTLFPQLASIPESQVVAIPPSTYDHVVSQPSGAPRFLTSDQCIGCHNASAILDNITPNMLIVDQQGERVNVSPYGEWSASLMGLAGRDPVFHAQLESETTLRPNLTGYLEDTCYRCHGVMGQRQIHLDSGAPFQHAMVYAVGNDRQAKYGALARDGISCTVCHGMSPEGLGTPATYTGLFNTAPPNEVYGPYQDPKTLPMRQALGITPREGNHIRSSALCGSCHSVILPEIPSAFPGKGPSQVSGITSGHEQATYLEWRNSAYQNETEPINPEVAQTCQQCHMPRNYQGRDLAFRIANNEDGLYPPVDNRAPDDEITGAIRDPFSRHTLVGINLFVMQMFEQFTSVLGVQAVDRLAPQDTALNLRTAQASSLQLARERTARLEIVSSQRDGEILDTLVRVTNLAGHKFPSGVGFRRGFLEFSVLDASQRVLWASGRTSAYGVILDRSGQPLSTEFSRTAWQPHYDVVDREDAVQIYEERTQDDGGMLTTSFVSLFHTVKDNRLLPRGWLNDAPGTDFMQPIGVGDDSRYHDGSGSDDVHFRVPSQAIRGATAVQVKLVYQSIPPYYLRDRFEGASGSETQRLYHVASRLNVQGTPIEGWRLEVASANRALNPPVAVNE
jgi:hypothetical protein